MFSKDKPHMSPPSSHGILRHRMRRKPAYRWFYGDMFPKDKTHICLLLPRMLFLDTE